MSRGISPYFFNEYKDEGCDLHPSCLDCPLEECRYDRDEEALQKRHENHEEIRRMRAEGVPFRQIARELGMAVGTIESAVYGGKRR